MNIIIIVTYILHVALLLQETMDKPGIEAKAKVIIPQNATKGIINVGNTIDKTSGTSNGLNNDRTIQNRNGDIIFLSHYTEERVISLTILSILSSLLIVITISFIYIYICKKYFRKECLHSIIVHTSCRLKMINFEKHFWNM